MALTSRRWQWPPGRRTGESQAPRIASYLLALALGTLAPFIALTAYLSFALVRHHNQRATQDIARSADVSAHSAERLVARIRILLQGLAQSGIVREMDPTRCDPALGSSMRLNAEYTNIFVVNAAGIRVCSAVTPPPGTPERVDPELFLDRARTGRGFTLGPPILGPVSGKWTVNAVQPIFQGKEFLGVVGVGIDLKALTSVLDPHNLPPSGVAVMIDANNRVVTRHPDAGHWIARDGSGAPSVVAARRGREKVLRAAGLDGIDRFWASRPIAGAPGWLVLAGVSTDLVLDEPRREAAWIAGLGFLSMLGAMLLSVAIARRISEPISAIAAAAPNLGEPGAAPLEPHGPAEATVLARELNRVHALRVGMEQRLRDERARLEGLVASAMDAVITMDSQRRIILFNAAAERMFGLASGEVLGGPLDRLLPERFRASHDRHVTTFQRSGITGRQMGALGTLWGLRASGEEFPIEASISQVEAGHQRYLTAIVRDVSERVEAEQRVLALNATLEQRVAERTAQLEAANQELQAFDYSVSHDLRGPLGRIQGFATAVLEDSGHALDPQSRGYLERVVATARHMDELVNDLLALSTVSRGEIVRIRVDLSAMARGIVDNLRRGNPARQVEVRIQPDLVAWADAGLARAMLDNLLGNAWKFTSRRDDALIEFGLAANGGKEEFFIRDNGAGFDPAAASHLFEPFRRLHSRTEFPGTGIGLATVRRILQRHGGSVRAEGAPGRGATFHFTLGT